MSEQEAVRFLTNLSGYLQSLWQRAGHSQLFSPEEMERMGFEVGLDAIGNVIGVVGEGDTRDSPLRTHGHRCRPYAAACGRRQNLRPRRSRRQRTPSPPWLWQHWPQAKEPGFKGKILVASVVEEEATSKGVRHLITQGIKADYASIRRTQRSRKHNRRLQRTDTTKNCR